MWLGRHANRFGPGGGSHEPQTLWCWCCCSCFCSHCCCCFVKAPWESLCVPVRSAVLLWSGGVLQNLMFNGLNVCRGGTCGTQWNLAASFASYCRLSFYKPLRACLRCSSSTMAGARAPSEIIEMWPLRCLQKKSCQLLVTFRQLFGVFFCNFNEISWV